MNNVDLELEDNTIHEDTRVRLLIDEISVMQTKTKDLESEFKQRKTNEEKRFRYVYSEWKNRFVQINEIVPTGYIRICKWYCGINNVF